VTAFERGTTLFLLLQVMVLVPNRT
jgi:hypothetical protein